MIHEAKQLARYGVSVHPLVPRTKRPIEKEWSKAPFWTPAKLEAKWKDNWNLGIRLGEFSKVADHYLHVIDCDVKGDDGDEDEMFDTLEQLLPDWQDFPHVLSGGGRGVHIYILLPKAYRSKKIRKSKHTVVVTDKDGTTHKPNAWEIELFGTSKQVATAPSIHPDTKKPYTWGKPLNLEDFIKLGVGPVIDTETVDGWVSGAGKTDGKRSSTRKPSVDFDREEKDNYATLKHHSLAGNIMTYRNGDPLTRKDIKNILDRLPEEWVTDYHKWLAGGFALHHQLMGSPEGLELWDWFSQSDMEAYTDEESLASRYEKFGLEYDKRDPITMRTLYQIAREEDPDFKLEEMDDDPVRQKLLELNRKHAVVILGGKTRISVEDDHEISFVSKQDFETYYLNQQVQVFDGNDKNGQPRYKIVSIATLWLKWPERRTYQGVCFDPSERVKDQFNLWRGLSEKPNAKASCNLLLKHIWNNVAKRDEVVYDFIIGWLAHMIQRPWEKPGTAIVLLGEKGVGKTILGEVMMELLKHHTIAVSSASHLTGNFNKHLGLAVLVRVEEAFWVGDKAAGSKLKDMITGLTMRIEPKGIDSMEVRSHHRFLFTSNESWVVPAGSGERRYFVTEVGNARKQDRAYFGAIWHQLRKEGGFGALMHFLQTYDLAGFDVGVAPKTRELAEQQIQSMNGIQRWWMSVLEAGDLGDKIPDFDEKGGGWPAGHAAIEKSDLYGQYETWISRQRFEGRAMMMTIWAKEMRKLCPSMGDYAPRSGEKRKQCYLLPPLQIVRDEFNATVDHAIQW